MPSLRRSVAGGDQGNGRAFARIAWPAFFVLVVTGIWNLAEVDITDTSTSYQVTVFVKVTLAIVSGAAAAIHQVGRTKLALALGGAIGLLSALGALFLGVLLRTGA